MILRDPLVIKPDTRTVKICISTLAACLILMACGGGEDNTNGQEGSLVVTTPLSPNAVLVAEPGAVSSSQSTISIATEMTPVASILATPVSGQISLQVSFYAFNEGAARIISYRWDFGDGNSASGQNVSHNYDTPNTYTATLTLTAANGDTDTTTRQIYVFASVADNSQAVVPASIKFYDGFNYVVNRLGDTIDALQIHGWSVKAENFGNQGKGYIYTTNQIPGYNGMFPGRNSNRVLALEGRPSSFGIQTNFYLHHGSDNPETLPGNVWIQYWIYINDYDDPSDQNDQMSHFENNGKFIYPTKDSYPSNSANWILGTSQNSKAPLNNNLEYRSASPYFYLADFQNIEYRYADGESNGEVGPTNVSERLRENRWTLVKLHIDTSTSSGRFEQWIKPIGGSWFKTTELIDGVTPGFSWQIPANDIGGHRAFRMPTTHNPCRPDSHLSCDFWIYMDDFSIANSEQDLPVYPY